MKKIAADRNYRMLKKAECDRDEFNPYVVFEAWDNRQEKESPGFDHKKHCIEWFPGLEEDGTGSMTDIWGRTYSIVRTTDQWGDSSVQITKENKWDE